MSDVIKFAKRIFTYGVVLSTMVWSVGVAALVPTVASAASCPTLSSGQLIKVVGAPAIYVLDGALRYRYFPDGDVFKSWNNDESYSKHYTSVTAECFRTLSQPAAAPFHVFFRPGSYVVKYVGEPSQLYVVQPGNVLATITADAAKALYGTNYKVMTVGLSEWPYYQKTGAAITEVKAHPGMLVSVNGKTWYVASATQIREVTASGMTANRFKAAFVHTVPASAVSGMTEGTQITAEEGALSNRIELSGSTTQPGNTGGSVVASLAANTPAAASIPQDATGVVYTIFNVRPASGSATLNDVVLKRTGLGAANDFNAVYLYDGSTRLTSGRSVSSDTNQVIFSNLNLALSGQKTLSVVADLHTTNAASGDESGFDVVELNGTAVSGVSGNIMRVGASSVSSVTVDNSGSSGSLRLGASEAEMARGTINAGSATYDVQIRRLTLTNAGSLANSNIANLKLVVGGKTIATAASMTGETAVFDVSPAFTVTKGETKTFYVYGDVTGGRVDDTIKFYVDETSDVYVVDTQYNTGANLTNSFASGDQTYTLTGGELTLAGNGPAAGNIGKNVTNVTLQKFSFSASNAVTIKNTRLSVYLVNAAGTAVGDVSHSYDLIKNVRLVDLDKNNQTLIGPQSNYGTGTTYSSNSFYKDFTDTYDISSGQTRHFAVVADIDSAMTSSWKVYTKVDFSQTNAVKYQDNAQFVSASSIVPNTLTGNQMTISGASLTVGLSKPPASASVVKGSSQDALGILLTPGTADDVRITSLKVRVHASTTAFDKIDGGVDGDTAANTVVNTVSIREEGATSVLATKNLSDSSGTIGAAGYYYVTFNTINYVVKAGQPKKLIVQLGLKDSISATRYVAATLDGDDDIDVETAADGKTVTENTTGRVNGGGGSDTVYLTVGTGGTVTVEVDGNTPTRNVVVSGQSTPVTFTTYKLRATQENFTMTGGAITIATTSHSRDISKITLTYKNKAGQTITKERAFSGTSTVFSDGDLDIWMPKDQYVLVTVGAYLNTINDGAVSGDAVKVLFNSGNPTLSGSSNLTNDFIFLGEASNSKQYGQTDSIAVNNSTAAAQVVRKTNVTAKKASVSESNHGGSENMIGAFTFTSESEPGSNQNSRLSTVVVSLSGTLITSNIGVGNNDITVNVYDSESISANNLVGTGILHGADAGATNSANIAITTRSEFNGSKTLYFVVDATDADFSDLTQNTEYLTLKLNNWVWVDGSISGSTSTPAATPEAGYPVSASTISY